MIFSQNKVLVVTAGHVGNTLFCTPAIRLLKKVHPELQIDSVVTHKRAVNVLINNPDIHTVYIRTARWRLLRLMQQYPLTIFLNNITFNDFFKELPPKTLTIGPSDPNKHRTVEIMEFMQQLLQCSVTSNDYGYVLKPIAEDIANIERQFSNIKRPIIGIHLGNARTQIHGWKFWYKNRTQDRRLWPLANYIALAQQLRHQDPTIHFVITGDKSERFLGETFGKNVPNTINFIGKTTISKLAALIQQLDIFITHDTGVLHIANAMQVPLIGLFAATDPKRTGPYPLTSRHMILQKAQMIDITPAEVCQAYHHFLNRSYELEHA